QNFVEDIFPMSYPAAQRLADVLELASAKKPVKVLDLAAGSGVWGIALAQRSPFVSVTAVDWPGVLDVTRRVATRLGVGDTFSFGEIAAWLIEAGFENPLTVDSPGPSPLILAKRP